ncbi:hypothetical protein [Dawidia soli]|uniref:Uncharacterized protein n=1 Tax=Dawidia soli TaxID=2782352 RepID=A0AAP2D8F3_9BACT|nr:hypothetical protein [Dawidia soli]MBT1687388.1 hypothetical protein [Dawidia soli]
MESGIILDASAIMQLMTSEHIENFENVAISESLILDNPPSIPALMFINCVFHNWFVLANYKHPISLNFINCEFRKGVFISGLEGRNSSQRFHFKSCIADTIRFDKNFISSGIEFINCLFQTLEIYESEIRGEFSCTDSEVNEVTFNLSKIANATFHGMKKVEEFQAFTCEFFDLSIRFSNLKKVSLVDVFCWRIGIYGATIESLWFYNVIGLQHLISSSFSKGCFIEGSLKTDRPKPGGELRIEQCDLSGGLTIKGDALTFLKATLDCANFLNGVVLFDGCSVDSLIFKGTNTKGDITLTNVDLKALEFSGFINKSELTFINCSVSYSPHGELQILDSDLGNAKFFNHDFSRYNFVKIKHSLLEEIKFASCTWFSFDQLRSHMSSENVLLNTNEQGRARREAFRQLKQASEKQGNRIQSLEFQAHELKALEQELSFTRKFLFEDRLILLLSKTNRYGLSWTVAFSWVFGLTIAFYIPMALLASKGISWLPPYSITAAFKSLCSVLWDHIGIFLQMFNPAHSPTSLLDNKTNLSPWYFLLDGIHRIVAAFLIVQLVSAFRKYVKS